MAGATSPVGERRSFERTHQDAKRCQVISPPIMIIEIPPLSWYFNFHLVLESVEGKETASVLSESGHQTGSGGAEGVVDTGSSCADVQTDRHTPSCEPLASSDGVGTSEEVEGETEKEVEDDGGNSEGQTSTDV